MPEMYLVCCSGRKFRWFSYYCDALLYFVKCTNFFRQPVVFLFRYDPDSGQFCLDSSYGSYP